MEWTKEKPKEPGWYWARETNGPEKPETVVKVHRRRADDTLVVRTSQSDYPLAEIDYAEWQGPIVPLQDEWIKCEDQMPPSLGGIFLLFLPLNEIQCTGFYNSQSNQFDLGAERIDAAKVSQWRRLPPDPLK